MGGIGSALVVVVVVILLFLLGREITLWYFKINELLTVIRDIRSQLPQGNSDKNLVVCSECKEFIHREAVVCKHCGVRFDQSPVYDGERSIAIPAYQLYLTKRFAIEKNATLEKFVVEGNVFDTLQDSLRYADERHKLELNSNCASVASSAATIPSSNSNESLLEEQRKQMEQLKITLDGGYYHCGAYEFESLSDAISHATSQANKG